MSWITLRTRETVDGDLATTTLEVLAAGGVARELFVYDTATATFSHPATARDVANYPVGRAAALAYNNDFYRDAEVTLTYPSPLAAREAADYLTGELRGYVAAETARQPADFGRTVVEVL